MQVDKILERNELRKTDERRNILSLFSAERTWTARQIKRKLPDVRLSTIYRNLNVLKKAGVIDETHVHEQETYYERTHKQHHDHVSCTRCDVVECVPCPAPELPDHRLELTKNCSSCTA